MRISTGIGNLSRIDDNFYSAKLFGDGTEGDCPTNALTGQLARVIETDRCQAVSLSLRMRKMLYLVRHCKAAGQQPEAALTADGRLQAKLLAEKLAVLPIERIIASPFRACEAVDRATRGTAWPVDRHRQAAGRARTGGRRSTELAGGAEVELRRS